MMMDDMMTNVVVVEDETDTRMQTKEKTQTRKAIAMRYKPDE